MYSSHLTFIGCKLELNESRMYILCNLLLLYWDIWTLLQKKLQNMNVLGKFTEVISPQTRYEAEFKQLSLKALGSIYIMQPYFIPWCLCQICSVGLHAFASCFHVLHFKCCPFSALNQDRSRWWIYMLGFFQPLKSRGFNGWIDLNSNQIGFFGKSC